MNSAHLTSVLAAVLMLVLLGAPAALAQSPASRAYPAPQAALPDAPKPDEKGARRAAERARRAELAGDWQAAFEGYAQALSLWPTKTEYWAGRELARSRLVQDLVARADREALAERLDSARVILRAALGLDPGYSVAQERLEQLQPRARAAQVSPAPFASEPPRVQPLPGSRTFNLRGSTRALYEEVARQFGLQAAYDEGLRERQARFRVDDVDFATAMRLLGQQTGTFWRAVNAKMFFVADDTPQKRAEFAPSVARTIVFPTSATPDRMTEITRLIREIAGIRRTQLDTRSRTLTVRDSPEAVALALQLVEELEQPSGEMMIEVELLEVDRSEARRLGITPPATGRVVTLTPADIEEAEGSLEGFINVIARVFGLPQSFAGLSSAQLTALVSSGQLSTNALIPPLIAFGGGRTVFLASLPGAAADFAQSLRLVRSGRRVLLRAEDGKPATFFVGDRVPFTLAALTPSVVVPQIIPTAPSPATPDTFPTSDMPVAVAALDVNGDNRVDLVVANAGADTISILLGNGDGTFGERTDLAVGVSPSAIATADFDGDGRPDLAVTNRADATVSILINDGAGSFNNLLTVPVGADPAALVAADLDGDGRIDLAVANSGNNRVVTLIGDGTGLFSTGVELETGAAPRAIAAGDLNGDRATDLIVANSGADSLSVYLGNGNGTFGVRTDFDTGQEPSGVAVGDLDGDNRLDVVTVNIAADTLTILLGNGDGTFRSRTDFSTNSMPSAVVVSDFNSDSRLDIAVANAGSDDVSVFVGNGDGTLALKTDFPAGAEPVALARGDFDADGRPDLATANRDADTVRILLNRVVVVQPADSFQPQFQFPGAQYEELGLKVRATPRMHPDNEVTLQLQFEIRTLTATELNGIPVISNRSVEQTVRLRENEPTLLAGIVQRGERLGVAGWPGLSAAPVAGHLAGRREPSRDETELLIIITPRRIRLAPRTDRIFYAGREVGAPTSAGSAQPPQ